MAVGKQYATFTDKGIDDAARKLDDWMARGMSGAIRQGMDEFGFRLAVASYSNMKLPSVGKRDPLHVGLRWGRTKQLHSEPQATGGAAEWQIRVQPQYLAMWQEAGTRPHTVFDPDKQRSKAFMKNKRRQDAAKARQTKWLNTDFNTLKGKARTNAKRSLDRTYKTIETTERNLQTLKSLTGTAAVMGYSDPSKIPARNKQSDWFKRNTPTAEAGNRAGQPRPVQVRAGQKVQVNKGVQATRPIWRGAIAISGWHRNRMAALMTQAYQKRS